MDNTNYNIDCPCGNTLNSEQEEYQLERMIIHCYKCNKTFELEWNLNAPIDRYEWTFEKKIKGEINLDQKLTFSKQPYSRLHNKLVWISDKVPKQLIRFIVQETPRIQVIADVASGASILVYPQEFDSLAEALAFARNEFERFKRGEVLQVNVTEEKLGWFDTMIKRVKSLWS